MKKTTTKIAFVTACIPIIFEYLSIRSVIDEALKGTKLKICGSVVALFVLKLDLLRPEAHTGQQTDGQANRQTLFYVGQA